MLTVLSLSVLSLSALAEFDDQKDLLYLYHTFIQLLYELENKDDIDINRLIESMERAEKTLENYK